MKRKHLYALLVLMLLAGIFYFSNSVHIGNAEGIITYSYGELQFTQPLTEREAREAKEILNGKLEFPDNPSCGFSENCAIVMDGIPFALACDGCEVVKNCDTGKYINLSPGEREILESMFTQRGGVFPCV